MMTGIDHPTSGTVRIGDVFLHTLSEGQMSVWRGRNLGIVFQFFQLLPMLSLLENVMLPMDFCDKYAPAEREGRAMALLAMVGLQGMEHKYPAAVTGGQQQSAAVARALANDPPILVADEPTGNLDTRTAERILEIFEEQVANRKTVVLVTHDNSLAQRAEGARSFDIQAMGEQERWFRINLKAAKNLDTQSINRVTLEEGIWPPGDRELVVECDKRDEIPAALGEMVTVQMPSGKTRRLKLVGVVHDQTLGASNNGGFFLAPAQAYITMDTLEWLDQPASYNMVYVTVGTRGDDEAYLRTVANWVSDEIELDGGLVYNTTVRGSHDHPNASYSEAMAGVLFMLGALVVFLSAFLITNTLSALLNQQAQQIAVMKTVGARKSSAPCKIRACRSVR